MSDLQIVLIVLGGLIIAAVLIYNWLQERKLRDNISEDFSVPHQDVLTEDLHTGKTAADNQATDNINTTKKAQDAAYADVPAVETAQPAAEVNLPELDNEKEPFIGELKAEAQPPVTDQPIPEVNKDIIPSDLSSAPIVSSLPVEVHPQVDLTAFLFAKKSVNAQKLLKATKDTLKSLDATVQMHGLDEQDQWHIIQDSVAADVEYKQAAFSLQLADRRGPVPSPVLNKFQFAVETIGVEVDTHVEWQGKGEASQRAINLDQFCMDVDQLVSVHLVHGDVAIHGTKFKGLAETNNMQLQDGKFHAYKNSTAHLAQFTLMNADEQPFTEEGLRNNVILGAVLQMEIPKVSNCDHVFEDMVKVATNMASSLDAHIVDDNKKPLGDVQIGKIKEQLKMIHAKMVTRGIMPGSASSMRLFN